MYQKAEQRKRNLFRTRALVSVKQPATVSSILRGTGYSHLSSISSESLERETATAESLRKHRHLETGCCGGSKDSMSSTACCTECAAEAELPLAKTAAPDMQGEEMVELVTGGSSKCNLSGDSQEITNNNDECSRSCTQEHEQNHVDRRSSCCERARAAYHAARDSGDADTRRRVMRTWNQWVRANKNASECEAYAVSMSCASRLIREHDCASEETPSTCCEQLSSYLSHVTERKNHYCGLSGDSTNRTECPDFS